MNKYLIALVHLGCFLFTSCSPQSNKEKVQEQQQEVNVYTHRHYAILWHQQAAIMESMAGTPGLGMKKLTCVGLDRQVLDY